MARPVIGITAYVETARWGVWEAPAALLPYAYIQSVEEAGGRVVMLPPDGRDGDVVHHLDGLILSGGADIDPTRYGQPPHPETYLRPDRDTGEFAVLAAALTASRNWRSIPTTTSAWPTPAASPSPPGPTTAS